MTSQSLQADVSPFSEGAEKLLLSVQGSAAGLRFQQLDSQHFAVSFPYDRDVVESLKQKFWARDREWHPETKTWRFKLDKYQEVQEWALEHYAATEINLLEEVSFFALLLLICWKGVPSA